MLYYRDESESRKLIKGRIDKFKDLCRKSRDLSRITDFLMEKHVMDPHEDLRQLGFFERIIPDYGLQVVQIKNRQTVRLKTSPSLLMEIEQNGIVDDAIKEGHHVALYGRMQDGMLVEAVALNLHSLPEPSQL